MNLTISNVKQERIAETRQRKKERKKVTVTELTRHSSPGDRYYDAKPYYLIIIIILLDPV